MFHFLISWLFIEIALAHFALWMFKRRERQHREFLRAYGRKVAAWR